MVALKRTSLKILNVPKYSLNKENILQNREKVLFCFLNQSTYYWNRIAQVKKNLNVMKKAIPSGSWLSPPPNQFTTAPGQERNLAGF